LAENAKIRFSAETPTCATVEPMKPLATYRHEVLRSDQTFMLRLREALEASWDMQTAYGAVEQAGNPALGRVSRKRRLRNGGAQLYE
jgi:hypothetical protein